jgi:hypothetical protein
MAAKAWGTTSQTQTRNAVDEVFFQNDLVSLCMLINRRARVMRVVDFRAGPSAEKKNFVIGLAQREGIEKAYTLVERDEVSTWVKLGFRKEGTIPGFYKRSDAFLLGMHIPSQRGELGERAQANSETRLAAASAQEQEEHDVTPEYAESARPESLELDPAHALAERTIVQAKKNAKELTLHPLPATKITPLDEAHAQKAVLVALRAGSACTAFDHFGRGVKRSAFTVTTRNGFELVASIETQACFSNAFVEFLTPPATESEGLATVSALRGLCEKLKNDGVVSCFSLSPSDDIALATAFAFNGFRRTGLLKGHIVFGTRLRAPRHDAIIWSRKLANPEGA